MGHCVFMLRPDSVYDDIPSKQYQFPKQYLERARGSIGDWVLYLEPVKVQDTRGYFAAAQVEKIVPDENAPDRFLALLTPGSYLEFPNPVPFNDDAGPIERGLLNEHGKLSGRAQAAVRPVSSPDFLRILEKGLYQADLVMPRLDEGNVEAGLGEERPTFIFETERQRVEPVSYTHLTLPTIYSV